MAKGPEAIPGLRELLSSSEKHLRWEAMKALADMGDPEALPIFAEQLESEDSDLRWMAAEGFINVGARAVRPLLELVLGSADSVFVLAGAHHVFRELHRHHALPEGFPAEELLRALKTTSLRERLKVVAHGALKHTEA